MEWPVDESGDEVISDAAKDFILRLLDRNKYERLGTRGMPLSGIAIDWFVSRVALF
jgi:hypothetical protein